MLLHSLWEITKLFDAMLDPQSHFHNYIHCACRSSSVKTAALNLLRKQAEAAVGMAMTYDLFDFAKENHLQLINGHSAEATSQRTSPAIPTKVSRMLHCLFMDRNLSSWLPIEKFKLPIEGSKLTHCQRIKWELRQRHCT